MFDASTLWKDRLGQGIKELGKYLRYIFNGHIVIVLVFLIGTAAYYYQGWVKTLSTDFPVAFLMAIFMALLLTHSPIYTFLMDADRIFLLPLEEQLHSYFLRSIFFSFFIQVYVLILGLAVLMPMYAQVNEGNFKAFFPFLAVLAAAKVANLLIRWKVQYYVDKNVHKMDSYVRYCLNGVLLYLLFSGANLWFFIPVVVIYVFLYLFYQSQTKLKGLKWEFLIGQEEKRMMAFYRLANMFTDVPKLKDSVKRRKWLDWVSQLIPYKHDEVYTYLFVNTFIRGGDYLGIFVRLTVIGFAALFLVSYGYVQVLFVVLFLFLTGFQLLPLWKHHQNKLWTELYPVGEKLKVHSFQKLLFTVLTIESLFLSAPLLLTSKWVMTVVSIGAGVVFSYFFVFVYSRNKLKSDQ